MNMRIDDNLDHVHHKSKRNRSKRNVNIKNRKNNLQSQEVKKSPIQLSENDTKTPPIQNGYNPDTPIISEPLSTDQVQSNEPLVKAAPIISETEPNILDKQLPETTPSNKSYKEKKLSARKKRQERQRKRKRKLLETAIHKLKSQNSDSDALTTLEETIKKQQEEPYDRNHVETHLLEKDILNDAIIKAPLQTTKSEQSAKDRFKNALKALNKNNNEADIEVYSKNHKDYLHANNFRSKIAERQRVKKIAASYLEKMGLNYTHNDFKILANTIADNLLFNIEQTLPRYKKSVEKLIERAQFPVRNGNNQTINSHKKSKTEEIVGSLFSHIPIDVYHGYININLNKNNKEFKIPDNNSDEIRDDLLESLLFHTHYTAHEHYNARIPLKKELYQEEEEDDDNNNNDKHKDGDSQHNQQHDDNSDGDNEDDSNKDDTENNKKHINDRSVSIPKTQSDITQTEISAYHKIDMQTARSKLAKALKKPTAHEGTPNQSHISHDTSRDTLQKLLQKKMANRDKESHVNLLKSRLKKTTEKFKILKK